MKLFAKCIGMRNIISWNVIYPTILYKIPILRSINILVHIAILNRHLQSFRTYYGDSVYGYASSMQVNT